MAEKALSFDGIDDKVESSENVPITGASARSLEAWVKFDELLANKIAVAASWGEEGTDSGLFSIASFGWAGAGHWAMWGFNADVASNGALSTGTWYYLVVTYDGTTVRLYQNGSLDNSEDKVLDTQAGVAIFGKKLGTAADRLWLKGVVDEVRISNIARTADEISAIWNSGNGVSFEVDADTVALWHMNEGEGSTIYDETTNNNDGTITGASWVDDSPFITPKTSAEAGQGAEALLNRAYILPEVGTGSESLGSRLLGAIEEGGGVETLLARLLASTETASGVDAGGLFFTSGDVGSGLDAILVLEALLTGADSGSGIDTAYLIKILLSTDSGLGAEAVAALLVTIVAGELMVGSDCLVVKIESAPKGGDMRLPPGGKTSIPSRRVNL